jgi:hypothetical protein
VVTMNPADKQLGVTIVILYTYTPSIPFYFSTAS